MADTAVDPLAAAGGGGGGDDLLMQVSSLLDQYLAQNPDSPIADAAESLQGAIQEEVQGGGSQSNPDQETPADMTSEPGGEPPPSADTSEPAGGGSPFRSFKDASKAAMADNALTQDKKKRGKVY